MNRGAAYYKVNEHQICSKLTGKFIRERGGGETDRSKYDSEGSFGRALVGTGILCHSIIDGSIPACPGSRTVPRS